MYTCTNCTSISILLHVWGLDQPSSVLVKRKSRKVRMDPGRDPSRLFSGLIAIGTVNIRCTKQSGPYLYFNIYSSKTSTAYTIAHLLYCKIFPEMPYQEQSWSHQILLQPNSFKKDMSSWGGYKATTQNEPVMACNKVNHVWLHVYHSNHTKEYNV